MGLSRRHFISLTLGGSLCWIGRVFAAAGPIDESGFIRIGGIEQWVAIRGRDRRNPIILYLHGGPGEAQSPFLHEFIPWQQDFTVVNWDQRGSGKTYGRNGPSTPDMKLDRLVDDATEIAQHLKNRFGQRKIILVGQSWGSFLGVHVIKRRPDLFHAFVGTGQVVNFVANVESQVHWARRQALAAGDTRTLMALDAAAALPANRGLLAEGDAARKWLMPPPDRAYAKMIYDFMGLRSDPTHISTRELQDQIRRTKGDVADWIAGPLFSGSKLKAVITSMDVRKLGLDISIPFFVIQGRDDHITSFDIAETYAEEVCAPVKEFVPINGGHFACFTNANQFVGALCEHVRPLAI